MGSRAQDALGEPYRAQRLARPMTPPTAEETLRSRGIVLPPAPVPRGSYVPVVIHGSMAFVSGMLPFHAGKLVATGLVGGEVTPAKAHEAARWAGLNALAALQAQLGSLDRVERILRVGVFVASAPNFTEQPAVANGASDLFVEVFGEAGKHARAAIGAARLPLDAPVEVELVAALRP